MGGAEEAGVTVPKGQQGQDTPLEAFERLAASLVGVPIAHLWRGYGSAVSFEWGALAPSTLRNGRQGQPRGEISLAVEWSWRIEGPDSIRCGSWSEEELWEPTFAALRGARIARCELFGALPEIALTTEDGLRFVSFSTTDGQPQWHLVDRRHPTPLWFTVREGQLHLGDGSEPAY